MNIKHIFCVVSSLLLMVSPPADAQQKKQDRPTPNITRVDELKMAVQNISTAVDTPDNLSGTTTHKPTQVVWLLDYTSIMRKHDLFSRLAEGISDAFETKDGSFRYTRHTFLLMNDKLQLLAREASKPAKISSELQQVYRSDPTNRVKNTFYYIQKTASAMQQMKGDRILVLLSLINGDTEFRTAQTVEMLRRSDIAFHAISREAIMSDSFWFRQDDSRKNKKLYYGGPESARFEYPWGWTLQQSDVTNLIPSGYGIYGLQRLANATDGRYHAYYPEQFSSPFCQTAECPLCKGSHLSCNRPYSYTILERYAPWVGSRSRYQAVLARSRLAQTYFSVWKKAYEEGLVKTGPPLKPGSTKQYNRQIDTWKRLHFRQGGGAQNLANRATLARKKIKVVDQLLRKFRGIQNKQAEEYGLPRVAAFIKLMDLELRITRFNLKQFVRFSEFVQKILQMRRIPRQLLFPLPVRPQKNGKLMYRAKNYYYCHGPDPITNVRFLGGKQMQKERSSLNDQVRDHLREFRGTPWGLAVRRLGPVKYKAWYRQITRGGGGGGDQEEKRKYPMSEQGTAQTQSGSGEARPGGSPTSRGAGNVQTGQ